MKGTDKKFHQGFLGTALDCAQFYAMKYGVVKDFIYLCDVKNGSSSDKERENSRAFEITLKGEPFITNFKGERIQDSDVYKTYLETGRATTELNYESSAIFELVEVIRGSKENNYQIVDVFFSMADIMSRLKEIAEEVEVPVEQ